MSDTTGSIKVTKITSAENPKIKRARALLGPTRRRKFGEITVEGIKTIGDALDSKAELLRVFYCEELVSTAPARRLLDRLSAGSTEIYSTSPAVFGKLSDTTTPQGIVAVFRRPEASLDAIIGPRTVEAAALGTAEVAAPALYVLLERVQDPGNVGTIVRAAAAVGASAVIMDSQCADPYGPKCIRASAGAVFRIPVVAGEPIREACRRLRDRGVFMIAAEPDASEIIYELVLTGPVGFVLGSEGAGLSGDSLELCYGRARIPMMKGVESLNVGVSAAVFLYEAFRQRNDLGSKPDKAL